jgi:prolyl oligopeptidase
MLSVLTRIALGQTPGEDPYLWLEDVDSDRALSWVRERNAATEGAFTQTPEFQALDERLLAILDSDARIPYVTTIGRHVYNFWRDATHTRGIWRRTTLADYAEEEPSWETVLDLDALATAEGENWVWAGVQCGPDLQPRCLVSLSRGGSDASVVREFDLTSRTFVPDGFQLPEAKSDTSWASNDAIFVGTDFGDGSLTTSGYPRTVRLWTRGTPLSEAQLVFEGQTEDVAVVAYHDDMPGFERDFVHRAVTFWTSELFLLRDGTPVRVEKPDDANASVWRDWLLLELRSNWEVGGRSFLSGSLIATDFEDFLAGGRDFDVLFTPTERSSLAGFSATKRHLLVNVLDNVRNRISVATPSKGGWQVSALPGVPDIGATSVSPVDPRRNDAYFLTTTDWVTPTSLRLGRVGKGEAVALKALPAFFDASGLRVQQHEATSKDGTRVPYFEVRRDDVALDGSHRTLLYGYGGFEVSLTPGYSGSVGAGWLERGGVYVVANIRGGGEFGPAWHQAALKANRPRAYEDFEAVAEDLIRRGVTSPAHLGIQGGSNGGLLMGNMYVRRPDLFGGVVCQVPLLDMKRYHRLLAGASWMGEYGDPDEPDQWSFIQGFSPYQMAKADAAYPPLLMMTSTRDDRVHPGHARKMAARLLEWGKHVDYFENIEGGHAGAANNKQTAFKAALAYTWLWQQLE